MTTVPKAGSSNRLKRLFETFVAALFGTMTAIAAPAQEAGEAISGALPALLAYADRDSPTLSQAHFVTEAAEQRVQSAGAWADPMLRIEPEDVLDDGFKPLPGQSARTRYQLMQDIPWQGKRGLRRAMAQAGADAAGADQDRVRSALHAEIRRAQADWLESNDRREVVIDQVALFSDLERVARARYGRGLAQQGDVLRAQVELTRLAAERAQLDGMVRASAARLNSLLGRAAAAPLVVPGSAPLEALPDLAESVERAQRDSPMVRMAAALAEAADQQRSLTFRERWPDLRVGVMAMQLDSTVEEWGLMVEFNLPLRLARRRADEAERSALLEAARAAHDDVYVRALGGLREAHADATAAITRRDLAEQTQRPQAELTLEASLAAYGTGGLDFLTVIDAALQVRQAQFDVIAACADYRRRLADFLDYLGEA